MSGKESHRFRPAEVAIAAIVVILLLAAALAGQKMIENARYTQLLADIEAFRSAVYSFQGVYQALPGDMSQADARTHLTSRSNNLGGATGSQANNGAIEAGYCNTDGEESCFVWQHLRAAGLIEGDAALSGAASMPVTPVGGVYDTISTGDWGNGKRNLKLLMRDIPGEIGQRLDEQFDDGNPSSGNISCYNGGTGAGGGCSQWNLHGTNAVFVTL